MPHRRGQRTRQTLHQRPTPQPRSQTPRRINQRIHLPQRVTGLDEEVARSSRPFSHRQCHVIRCSVTASWSPVSQDGIESTTRKSRKPLQHCSRSPSASKPTPQREHRSPPLLWRGSLGAASLLSGGIRLMRPAGIEPAACGLKDRCSLAPRREPLTTELRAREVQDATTSTPMRKRQERATVGATSRSSRSLHRPGS
jgi:hypothetical protein